MNSTELLGYMSTIAETAFLLFLSQKYQGRQRSMGACNPSNGITKRKRPSTRWPQSGCPSTRVYSRLAAALDGLRGDFPTVNIRALSILSPQQRWQRQAVLDVRTQSVQEHSQHNHLAYQVVCAFQVLEHIPDPASFIAACLDCLEPGGLLIYGVPSDDSYLKFVQNDWLNLPPHHLTRWPDAALEAFPKLYPVGLVSIEHETLSDVHLRSYVGTMIRRRLSLLFGRMETMVDRSLSARLLNRCAGVLAGSILKIFSDEVFRPRGHTVIAIYRKEAPSVSE